MNLETVLLGFLNEDSMTGYDLSKKMDVSVGFFWHATHPQIYTCLKKLVSQGYITFDHEVPEFGPAKKIYSITKTGKENLLQSIKDDIETEEIKFPMFVSMFNG
ncbi:MAG: PadR family transcriptional regulator [Candidatus Marinimicrobia bacterium]|nr:PadR family transcriptional regulator [Candidatus Neomarinimicrobiota bacterium]